MVSDAFMQWVIAGVPILLLLFVIYYLLIRFRLSGPRGFVLPGEFEMPSEGVRGFVPSFYRGAEIISTGRPPEPPHDESIGGWGVKGGELKLDYNRDFLGQKPGYLWLGERAIYFRYSAPAVDDFDQYVRVLMADIVSADEGKPSPRKGFRDLRIFVGEHGARCYRDFLVPAGKLTTLIDRINARVKSLAESAPRAEASPDSPENP